MIHIIYTNVVLNWRHLKSESIKHGDPITKPLHSYTQSRPLLVPSTHSYAAIATGSVLVACRFTECLILRFPLGFSVRAWQVVE